MSDDIEWWMGLPTGDERPTEFAPGDRVRAVRSGRTGTVERRDNHRDTTYDVLMDDGAQWRWVGPHLLEIEASDG